VSNRTRVSSHDLTGFSDQLPHLCILARPQSMMNSLVASSKEPFACRTDQHEVYDPHLGYPSVASAFRPTPANISARVVPSALAIRSAATIDGGLSAPYRPLASSALSVNSRLCIALVWWRHVAR
jgi:hypothetical protein